MHYATTFFWYVSRCIINEKSTEKHFFLLPFADILDRLKNDSLKNLFVFGSKDDSFIGNLNASFATPTKAKDGKEETHLTVVNMRGEVTESSIKSVGSSGKCKYIQGTDIITLL